MTFSHQAPHLGEVRSLIFTFTKNDTNQSGTWPTCAKEALDFLWSKPLFSTCSFVTHFVFMAQVRLWVIWLDVIWGKSRLRVTADVIAGGRTANSALEAWWVVHKLGAHAVWAHEANACSRRVVRAHSCTWGFIFSYFVLSYWLFFGLV